MVRGELERLGANLGRAAELGGTLAAGERREGLEREFARNEVRGDGLGRDLAFKERQGQVGGGFQRERRARSSLSVVATCDCTAAKSAAGSDLTSLTLASALPGAGNRAGLAS
jgi:hypothetical protein